MSFAWESNPQYLAQVGHTLGGAWIVFLVGLIWGPSDLLVGLAALVVGAAIKETWDVVKAPWGEGDSWADSLMDFAFWVLGGVLGLITYGVSQHFGRVA